MHGNCCQRICWLPDYWLDSARASPSSLVFLWWEYSCHYLRALCHCQCVLTQPYLFKQGWMSALSHCAVYPEKPTIAMWLTKTWPTGDSNLTIAMNSNWRVKHYSVGDVIFTPSDKISVRKHTNATWAAIRDAHKIPKKKKQDEGNTRGLIHQCSCAEVAAASA